MPLGGRWSRGNLRQPSFQRRSDKSLTPIYNTFPDGEKDFTELNWLPLEIVQSYSTSSQQTNTITPIDVSNHDIIWLETVVVESIKGDKGNDGNKGDKGDLGNSIDRTLLTEQLLPGEFWVDKTGAKNNFTAVE